jgi:hypothetical protein
MSVIFQSHLKMQRECQCPHTKCRKSLVTFSAGKSSDIKTEHLAAVHWTAYSCAEMSSWSNGGPAVQFRQNEVASVIHGQGTVPVRYIVHTVLVFSIP